MRLLVTAAQKNEMTPNSVTREIPTILGPYRASDGIMTGLCKSLAGI